jgi:cytochrome c-type biogenesis protein CcmH
VSDRRRSDDRAGAGAASTDERGGDQAGLSDRGIGGWWPWILMAVVVVATLGFGARAPSEPPTNADRVLELSQAIKCPQCAGQSVAESDVTVSREIRRDIARRVEEGQTDEQVLEYYAGVFGDDVLLNPPADGVAGIVWMLPVVALVAGLAGLVVVFRRWSTPARHATRADQELVAEALDDGGGLDDGSEASS